MLSRDEIGQQIRRQRRARGMSLQDVAEVTGISASTLSKIENGIVELNYTRMIAISEGIGVNLTELITAEPTNREPAMVTARRSITRAGSGAVSKTRNYVYEYLNTDIAKKKMVPAIATLLPRTVEEYGTFAEHRGEEFVIVLEGEAELHTEHYEPVLLAKGDSFYIDSTMPHAMVSVSDEPARILFVCTHGIPEENKETPGRRKKQTRKKMHGARKRKEPSPQRG